ncbi:helix-turn-helix domain-containing protein [uncultured Cellulomonas sp.]|uniref:helix-turn-helix domain-containing protein n=1 Tax=uncultured Cellulomonas sp. TaxID=189682 RepID=UPI002611C114|nr:helix-turn-helix domain-containing protein [uncultured Cellulomonas sp.]
MPPRFLTLADVTEILNISTAQAYALVRSGDLPAIQIGGRLQWRIESSELESYIARMYEQTRARLEADGGEGVPGGATARPDAGRGAGSTVQEGTAP